MIKQKLCFKDLTYFNNFNGRSNSSFGQQNILCSYCSNCKRCVREECYCNISFSNLTDIYICFDCGNHFCENCDEYYKIDIYQNKIDKIVCKSCGKIDVLNEKVKKLKERKEN